MSYQPKTGAPCHCRPGQQRDNCTDCEGTGMRIDFAKIRARVTDTAKPDRAAAIDSSIRPEVRELLELEPLTYAGAGAILSRVLNQRDRLERELIETASRLEGERNHSEWDRAEAVNVLEEVTRRYRNAIDEREELRAKLAKIDANAGESVEWIRRVIRGGD